MQVSLYLALHLQIQISAVQKKVIKGLKKVWEQLRLYHIFRYLHYSQSITPMRAKTRQFNRLLVRICE